MPIQDQLEIIRADGQIEFYDLDPGRGITNIGRDPENDVVIDSPGIAPFHAVLDHRQKPYRLMVLSFEGKTTLGGQTLPPNVSSEIHNWDNIRLDGYTIILLESAGAARPAPAAAPGPIPQPPPPVPGPMAAPPPPVTTAPIPVPMAQAAPPPLRHPEGAPTFQRLAGLSTLPLDYLDEIIVTELSEREWTVSVEQTATLQVTVANGGPIVAMFEVWVDGLDADWFTISPPQVNLYEGERTTVTITITPPRLPTSRAGAHPFAVVVTSANYPGRHSRRGATLTINPYYEFTTDELSPKQQTVSWSKRSGKAILPITNKGNSNTLFRLEGADDERACSFEFRVPGEAVSLATQAEMRLSPEETATVPIHITPHSRRLIGLRKRLHSFTITTIMLEVGQTPRMVLGQLKSAPLIGFWHLLLIFLLLIMGIVYFFMPGPNPRLWREEGAQALATDEEITLNYNTSRFMSLGPNHILNRINALFLKLKLERKRIGEPDNTYEIVQVPLPDRPSGASKDDPQWDSVYRLTVENWLTLLYQPLAQRAEYKVFVTPVRPTIEVSPAQAQIELGQSVTLSWKQEYAERLELTANGLTIAAFDSPKEVGTYSELKPETDTVYIFKAYNIYTGNDDPETANATVKIVVPPPIIKLFVAQPGEIVGGTPVAFNWLVAGADLVSLESDDPADRPIPVGPEGSINKQPMRNTQFTLRAVREAPAGTATAVATQYVTVLPTPSPPTIKYFVADPEKLVRGDKSSVKLKWSIIGDVTNIEISGPSLASPITNLTDKEGSVNVTVKDSTLFVLTAFNQTQKVSANTQVQVVEPTPTPTPVPPPPTVTFYRPTTNSQVICTDLGDSNWDCTVEMGSTLQVSWRVSNDATTVNIRGLGDVGFEGTNEVINPGATKGYTGFRGEDAGDYPLRATNDSGTTMRTIHVTVIPKQPPSPPRNFHGPSGSVPPPYTLTWNPPASHPSSVVGYRIYRSLVPPGNDFDWSQDIDASTTSYDETPPDCTQNYVYYIVALYLDVNGNERETAASSPSWGSPGVCP